MTRARLATLASLALACTAPEPTAQVPDWLRPAADVPPAPLSQKPGDPQWLTLSSIAPCDAYLAAAPAAVGRLLEWQTCPEGQPGCRALLPEPDSQRAQLFGGGLDYTLHAGWTASGVHLAIVDHSEREKIALAPLDGPPYLVLDLANFKGRCHFLRADFAEASASLTLTESDGPADSAAIFFAGPLHADPAWHTPAARHDRVGRVSLSGRSLVLADEAIRRSDPQTGVFTELARTDSCCAYAVGTSVVFLSRGQILAAVTPGAAPLVLHEPEPATIHELHMVGGAFYWTRGIGHWTRGVGQGPWQIDHVELWTAPATDEPARFAARKITDLDLQQTPGQHGGRVAVGSLVIGGGKVAVSHHHEPTDSSRVIVVDVASGAQRVWQPGPGAGVSRVVFVSPEELAAEVRGSNNHETYKRIRHDTLPVLAPPSARPQHQPKPK